MFVDFVGTANGSKAALEAVQTVVDIKLLTMTHYEKLQCKWQKPIKSHQGRPTSEFKKGFQQLPTPSEPP